MRGLRSRVNANHPLVVTLLPCGAVPQAELNDLARDLSAKGIDVRLAKQRPVPEEAFVSHRRQYRADEFLRVARSEPGDRVLVVTNCDLYADNLNFVFGLADAPGRCAAISLFRLRMGADEEIFRRRAMKEAVHELGHTLGLPHCARPRCVMHFSNSLGETDDKETDWCEGCENQIQRERGNVSLS
ncbi:MAG: archaemetzincin family Zn-dependent metalloprotease [Chloroflexota bacterium]